MTRGSLYQAICRWRPSRFDRLAFVTLVVAALVLTAKGWLDAHPELNPWAPLNLADPDGWATRQKLANLRSDAAECRAVLDRSGVTFTELAPAGDDACARPDRIVLDEGPLRPASPPTTCAVAAALERWLDMVVRPAAVEELGSALARVEHFGAFSCRRIYGRAQDRWSEHATGNAIDIAAFALEDGRRISVLADWNDGGDRSAFLRRVRDGACDAFATTLSPDYNAAHRDHLHLDQQPRGWGSVCR